MMKECMGSRPYQVSRQKLTVKCTLIFILRAPSGILKNEKKDHVYRFIGADDPSHGAPASKKEEWKQYQENVKAEKLDSGQKTPYQLDPKNYVIGEDPRRKVNNRW